jgi:hypothetical protein
MIYYNSKLAYQMISRFAINISATWFWAKAIFKQSWPASFIEPSVCIRIELIYFAKLRKNDV